LRQEHGHARPHPTFSAARDGTGIAEMTHTAPAEPATKGASNMRRIRLFGMLAGAAVAAFAVGPAGAQTDVKFALDWKFEGPAAPYFVALDKGYYKAEGLNVTIDSGPGSVAGIARVAAGTYPIGFFDINSLVKFQDQNPDKKVQAVLMVYDRPPFAIVGRKSKGISADPKSLAGKKFGAPAADGAYAQWPIFKSVNKLDDSSMKFENVGFPVREPMLASGDVDAVFGFSFSVFMNLKSRGLPVDDIVLMLMSDHGVELYGNVLMVSPKFAAEKPEAIKGFIKALTKGLRDTVADPAAATATVIKRNDVAKQDVEKERLELSLTQNFVTPWVKANGYGGIDKERFAKSIDQIGLTFNFKSKPKVEDIFTEAFLPPPAERKVN
jgi:NitT/TauT family transport system substrate-binding protein